MNTSELFTMYAISVAVALLYGTGAFTIAMWIEQGGLRRRRAARARARRAAHHQSPAKAGRFSRAVRLRMRRRSA